jgi:hypothetical protein
MKNHVKVPVSLFEATLVLLIFLFFPLIQAWSQSNYAVQDNIIYRFTKYVNWPDEDRLKLQINKTAIENRELDIATELLSLGIIIK